VPATSFDFVVLTVCGWINRRQLLAIEYLREENRVLREQLGDQHLLLSDAQRRRLAEKGKALKWSEFLRTHWEGLAAADFFTVEVLTLSGLTRYHVLFFMELKSRVVHIAGIVYEPGESWMMQIGRNLLDAVGGFLLGKTRLILDRDPLFTAQFRRPLRDEGVTPLRLPRRSPNLNAYAERFVGSIRRECLDKIVSLGEAHLRRVVTEYASHYLLERNHQGLGNQLIKARASPENDNGNAQVYCHERLGGTLKYYSFSPQEQVG